MNESIRQIVVDLARECEAFSRYAVEAADRGSFSEGYRSEAEASAFAALAVCEAAFA